MFWACCIQFWPCHWLHTISVLQLCCHISLPAHSPSETNMSVVLDLSNQLPKLSATADELEKMLTWIETDIFPLTTRGVALGNKVFGAAILDSSFQTILAKTNAEIESPLFHGEVHLISEWSKLTNHRASVGLRPRNASFYPLMNPVACALVPLSGLAFNECITCSPTNSRPSRAFHMISISFMNCGVLPRIGSKTSFARRHVWWNW